MRVVAHRGYSAVHPENSPESFEAAIACGADFIETDIRLSRDQQLVCCHDADLRRLAGVDLAIGQATHEQLQQAMRGTGLRLLTLDAVLAIAKGRVKVMLDVKPDLPGLASRIVAAIDAAGAQDDVIYGVRQFDRLSELRALAPHVPLLAMPMDPDADLPGFLIDGVVAVRLWEHELSDARIARIHDSGREVWVTAGFKSRGELPGEIDAQRLRELAGLGVDAVLVNDPVQAIAALAAGTGSSCSNDS